MSMCFFFCLLGYNVTYSNDKRHGQSGYAVSSEVEKIQTEIMTYGPVEGAFTVYADFPSYKSGKRCILVGPSSVFILGSLNSSVFE